MHKSRLRWPIRSTIAAAALLALANTVALAQSKPAEPGAASGQTLPRYASLKFDRVNLRTGPGTEYPTVWVYRKAGLPLEITKEYESWRQVRDADGAAGWVLQSALSGRRTALIEPWATKPGTAPPSAAVFAEASEKARAIANVETGVIANVLSCDGKWCWVSVDQYRGYIQQKRLWGVYQAEILK